MAVHERNFPLSGGVYDGLPPNKVPDNAVSWARQADFGYPLELRKSLGMTRHVTDASGSFIAGTNDRVRNIFDYQEAGTNYLLCIKGDGATYDKIWDISSGATAILQITRPSGTDELTNQPLPVAIWDDEIFVVNGKNPADQAGSYAYGIDVYRSGGAWTTSTIGIVYSSATTAPTASAITSGPLVDRSTYGYRILGYDATRGQYGALTGTSGEAMEVWVEVPADQEGCVLTLNTTATNLGTEQARIYRTTRNGADFYYEGNLTGASAAFTSTMTDEQLVVQDAYREGGPPPDTFYLIARHNERLCGIGTTNPERLYFSQASKPHEWAPGDYRELPPLGKPVGLASRGHLVHIHYDTGLIVTINGQDVKSGKVATDCKEVYGSVNNASIAEATFRSYFVGNDGVMQFTGQACPTKISFAIDGTWEGLTSASLSQATGVIYDRPRGREYWALLPADNLLVKVPVEGAQPGTLLSVDNCHGTALGRQRTGGTTKIYLGTDEGAVFQMDTTGAYGTAAQLLDTTVISATSGVINVAASDAMTTNYGYLGMPITIANGGQAGETVWVTGQTTVSQVRRFTHTPALTTAPAAGDRILIGALPFTVYTKWWDMDRPSQTKRWVGCKVNTKQDTNSSNRSPLLRVYAVAQDYIPDDPRGDDLAWEYVGAVDCERPEAEWMHVGNLFGAYFALKLITYDYQVVRTLQSVDLRYEYMRKGPLL